MGMLILLLGVFAILRPSEANSCLDLTDTGHKCVRDEDGSVGLSNCGITDDDVDGGALGLCLDEAGRADISSLDLLGNSLATVPEGIFHNLTALKELKLQDNVITTLEDSCFQDLTKLEDLRLNNNSLTSLPEGVFEDLTVLRELYLADNFLTTLPEGVFRNLAALGELSLRRNSLANLPENVFQSLTVLLELWMSDNSLALLPEGIFNDLNALQYLSLRNNSLTTLPEAVFQDQTGLLLLNLEENALECLPAIPSPTLEPNDDYLSSTYDDVVGLLTDPYGDLCGCPVSDMTDNVCGEKVCTPGQAGYTCAPVPTTPASVAPTTTPVSVSKAPAPILPAPVTPAPATRATVTPATVGPIVAPVSISEAPVPGTSSPNAPVRDTPAPGTQTPESAPEGASSEGGASMVAVVAGVGAGALALGLATLGFFLRRRQAAKKKDASPSASHSDGGADLEDGGGELHQQRKPDMSSTIPIVAAVGNGIPIVAAGGSGTGVPPPFGQGNSAPPPPPPPPPYAHDETHLTGGLSLAANQQRVTAETDLGKDDEPIQSFAAPTVGVSQKPSPEGKTTPPCDEEGGKCDGVGGGKSSRSVAAEQVSTATGSTANVSTEERTAERAGSGFGLSAVEGDDDVAAPTGVAASDGRQKTSIGLGYGQSALAAAEELAHSCQIPGVSEAATMVAILIRLVTDSRDGTTRGGAGVKRCRSIVVMLERAATVIGKDGDRNTEAGRVLIEEVLDAVADLVELIKTYQSKSKLSKLLTSTLFKRRQEELSAVVDSAILHLQLGLQVQVGQDVAEGLHLHKSATADAKAEVLAKARRARRQRKLDQIEIPAEHVVMTDELLGSGGFGQVYLADYNGHNVAAKVQHIFHGLGRQGDGDMLKGPRRDQSDAVRESTQRKAFLRELEAMIRLRNPHIVNVHGAITSLPDRLVLVLELLSGGDLRNMLRSAEEPLPEEQCRQIFRDICTGMAFLHSKKTVHGDLKSANILLDGRGRAKIGDFGTSRWTQNTEQSTGLATYTATAGPSAPISFAWTAPEVWDKKGNSKASDVYSFGMVAWEVLTRQTPWADQAQPRDIYLRVVIHGDRPTIPVDCPADIAAMLGGCWTQEPDERPTFRALLDGEKAPVERKAP
eukprot:g13969.t1